MSRRTSKTSAGQDQALPVRAGQGRGRLSRGCGPEHGDEVVERLSRRQDRCVRAWMRSSRCSSLWRQMVPRNRKIRKAPIATVCAPRSRAQAPSARDRSVEYRTTVVVPKRPRLCQAAGSCWRRWAETTASRPEPADVADARADAHPTGPGPRRGLGGLHRQRDARGRPRNAGPAGPSTGVENDGSPAQSWASRSDFSDQSGGGRI